MKTKKLTSTVFALALGLGLAFGINYVSAGTAGTFNGPSSGFPNCPTTDDACNTPINVGTSPQVKNGGLSVNAFTAYMDSVFYQGVTVKQISDGAEHYACVDGTGKFVMCGGTVQVSPASYGQTFVINNIPGFSNPSGGIKSAYDGSHNSAFTASIQAVVTRGGSTPPSTMLSLLKNGTQLSCVAVPAGSPSTVNFPSATFDVFDTITIGANLSC
jgi:hypothetical protein